MDAPNKLLAIGGWIGTVVMAGLLVWLLLNPRIRALTRLTVLEGIRRMEFQSILALGLILLAGMGAVALMPSVRQMPWWNIVIERVSQGENSLTPGVNTDPTKEFWDHFPFFLQSGMLFFAELFTVALAFAQTLFLISQDLQQGFLLTLLPKPMSRGEYLWGRGLGAVTTVSIAWIALVVEVWIIFVIHDPPALTDWSRPESKILLCGGVLLFKWISAIAILIYATLRLPPVAGGLVTFIWLTGGHIAVMLHNVATDITMPILGRIAFCIGYVTLPHYDGAWSGTILDPATNQFHTASDVATFIGWTLVYTMAFGLGSWVLFRKRDL
ncbi:MAG: hypothetical protein ABI743_05000 [bacterium]